MSLNLSSLIVSGQKIVVIVANSIRLVVMIRGVKATDFQRSKNAMKWKNYRVMRARWKLGLVKGWKDRMGSIYLGR